MGRSEAQRRGPQESVDPRELLNGVNRALGYLTPQGLMDTFVTKPTAEALVRAGEGSKGKGRSGQGGRREQL